MDLLHTAHVPAGSGPFPTVVAFHGWGASAHDLLGLAPYLHGGDALVLCPQGPVEVPVGPGMTGYGWFPLVPGEPPDLRQVRRAGLRVGAFLDEALARYPADRSRLVLAGFSQGGGMALERALREPERLAGLVVLSSWLPRPLAAALPKHPQLRELPVLEVHGTEDPMIPIARARETRDALTDLGVELTYREFSMGHEIQPEALRVVVDWLEEVLARNRGEGRKPGDPQA